MGLTSIRRTPKEAISDPAPTNPKRQMDSTQGKKKKTVYVSAQKTRRFLFVPSSLFCFDLRAETVWQQYGGAEGKQDPLRQLTFNTDRMIPVFKLPIHKHRISKAADGNT